MTRVDNLVKWTLFFLMLAMVVDVTWQVASRYVFMRPSSYTEEIARFLLIWISFLGGAYAFRKKMHLGIDLLTEKLSVDKQRIANLFSYVVSGLFALLVLVFGGSQLTLLTWELEQVSGALGLPMAYVYSVIPMSGLLIVCYSLEFMIAEVRRGDC
ncbi:TRAP transporter small permease [Maricurvus nonylphenolicus]|uniref:TRAP transporter small permease n=1 Tax=Maricurvus nonylphenolicus TaxID=1008307 RepID=UPI0036F3C154